MTREEAIKRMESMRWEHATNPCPDRTAFDMAISALSENKWIPVSERLPEEGKSVLVCLRTQGGMAQAVSERFNVSGEWIWSALGGRKPLAWQPLPEPYKGESEVAT